MHLFLVVSVFCRRECCVVVICRDLYSMIVFCLETKLTKSASQRVSSGPQLQVFDSPVRTSLHGGMSLELPGEWLTHTDRYLTVMFPYGE